MSRKAVSPLGIDDLILIDQTDMEIVLKHISGTTLIRGLKDAPIATKELVRSSMSDRKGDQFLDEIHNHPPLTASVRDAAKITILRTVIDLYERGNIQISGAETTTFLPTLEPHSDYAETTVKTPPTNTDTDEDLDYFFEDLARIDELEAQEDADFDDPPHSRWRQFVQGKYVNRMSKNLFRTLRQEIEGYETILVGLMGFLVTTVSCLWLGWWDLLLLMGVLYMSEVWIHGSLHFFEKLPSRKDHPFWVDTAMTLVDVSKIARKSILAIEDALPAVEDHYARSGLRWVVDQVDCALIQQRMVTEREKNHREATRDVRLYRKFAQRIWGVSGIFFGVRMAGDAEATWLSYAHLPLIGACLGMCLWWLADYFEEIGDEQKRHQAMIEAGVLLIEKRERPDVIEDNLLSYLSRKQRERYRRVQAELQNTWSAKKRENETSKQPMP